jgi:hypothetical protein
MNGIVMGSGGGAVAGDETLNEKPQFAFAALFAAVAPVPAAVAPRYGEDRVRLVALATELTWYGVFAWDANSSHWPIRLDVKLVPVPLTVGENWCTSTVPVSAVWPPSASLME